MFDELIEDSKDLLEGFGIDVLFWEKEASLDLIESARIIFQDKEDAFANPYELAVYFLEGMTSVFKEQSIADNEAGFHTTNDGRLITSVIASQDGLQEESLNLIQNAKGHQVVDVYQEVLQPLNLHCPTCACDTEIATYDEVIEKREQYLVKLKEVLGKSD